MCVTGDHTTPTFISDHTFEPVPILACKLSNYLQDKKTESKLIDGVQTFDEIACSENAKSALGRFRSIDLINLLKKIKSFDD